MNILLPKFKITDSVNNDDIECTSCTVNDENRRFNPIEKPWQILKCKQLKLEIIKFIKFTSKKGKIIRTPKVTQNISGDGNCHTLSYFITGTKDSHMEIRKHIAAVRNIPN